MLDKREIRAYVETVILGPLMAQNLSALYQSLKRRGAPASEFDEIMTAAREYLSEGYAAELKKLDAFVDECRRESRHLRIVK
jgi:hypothetical protein